MNDYKGKSTCDCGTEMESVFKDEYYHIFWCSLCGTVMMRSAFSGSIVKHLIAGEWKIYKEKKI